MADCTTEFLQIASGYLRYAPVPLQRLHVAELAKVLTISKKAFEMLNLARFPLKALRFIRALRWLLPGTPPSFGIPEVGNKPLL